MRDLWLQFLMIGPYTSDIRFLVNSVETTMLPIKGIDTIFDNVTCVTTGCVGLCYNFKDIGSALLK